MLQLSVLGFLHTEVAKTVETLLPKDDPRQLADRVANRMGLNLGITHFLGWWKWGELALQLLLWTIYTWIRRQGW